MAKDNRAPRDRFTARYWQRTRARARRLEPSEVADMLGLTESRIRQLVASGQLRASRPGPRLTLIRRAALRKFCREHPEYAQKARWRRLQKLAKGTQG